MTENETTITGTAESIQARAAAKAWSEACASLFRLCREDSEDGGDGLEQRATALAGSAGPYGVRLCHTQAVLLLAASDLLSDRLHAVPLARDGDALQRALREADGQTDLLAQLCRQAAGYDGGRCGIPI
jgi:hypothetical protein